MNSKDYLAHHGVKGMKWGVRKDRTRGSSKKAIPLEKFDTEKFKKEQYRKIGKKAAVASLASIGSMAAGALMAKNSVGGEASTVLLNAGAVGLVATGRLAVRSVQKTNQKAYNIQGMKQGVKEDRKRVESMSKRLDAMDRDPKVSKLELYEAALEEADRVRTDPESMKKAQRLVNNIWGNYELEITEGYGAEYNLDY